MGGNNIKVKRYEDVTHLNAVYDGRKKERERAVEFFSFAFSLSSRASRHATSTTLARPGRCRGHVTISRSATRSATRSLEDQRSRDSRGLEISQANRQSAMCVRTLVGNETANEPIGDSRQDVKRGKTSRVKEKYMKLYEEMLEKEELQRRQAENVLYLPDLADDVLVASTNHYSLMLKKLSTYYEVVRHSKAFKILFYTSQPAHIITIAAVLFVTSVLFPTKGMQVSNYPYSRMMSFIYLASFVVHFGAQIWMTFVSGLSLYFALPRHAFGEVQRVLFPRYFTINACLSLITLLIFVKHHPTHTWDAEIAVQVGAMSGAFFLELLIRLYLTPPLLQLIVQKNNFERIAGVGNEIGRHNPGPLKNCTHYLKIHRAFRRVHVCIAMGNMLTMACTVLHLYYIASKLCAL